eukprot:150037_1
MPSFNVSENSWKFQYPLFGRNYEINWICNTSINDYNVIHRASDEYGVKIESKYACSKGCFFTSNDGKNGLDLSSLSGQLIYGIDDDLTYSYQYTPCSNYVVCNNSDVMAMRWDIQ